MPSIDQLPVLLVAIALLLHILGERRAVQLTGRARSSRARLRALAFYAALVVTVLALEGPIDRYSPRLLWVHMLQHVLLLSVAAPLLVLGAPWMSIWRPLPLGFRRTVARTVARSAWLLPLRAIARLLGRPWPALIACSADLAVWHLPGAYDLTLRSEWVHVLEHVSFVLLGVLVWTQVLDSPPLRSRLALSARIYYMLGFDVVCWLLSLVLAFAGHPLYPHYERLVSRPLGISALSDQQIAGGVMLGLGSLAATLYVFVGLYRWLGEPERGAQHRQYA